MSTKLSNELEHLVNRRKQLIRHIEFLYSTKYDVQLQVEDTEKQLEILEKYMISKGWER
jgi:chaperonin cofactor prefoldin